MKNIFLLLFVVLFFFSCESNLSVRENNSDDELQSFFDNLIINDTLTDLNFKKILPDSGKIVNGLKEDKWLEYWLDTTFKKSSDTVIIGGQKVLMAFDAHVLASAGNYSNGKREGRWVTFKASGRIFPIAWEKYIITNYKEGKKNGSQCFLFSRDTFFTRSYKNDMEEGIEKIFDTDRSCKVYMAHNGKTKLTGEYYASGLLKAKFTDTIINGRQLIAFRTFYPNAKKESEGYYCNGKTDGSLKYFHKNLKPWTEYLYKNGNLLEVIYNYNSMGDTMPKGTLKNGTGTLLLYDDDGFVTDTFDYVNGQAKE